MLVKSTIAAVLLMFVSVSFGQAQTNGTGEKVYESEPTFGIKRYHHAATSAQAFLDGAANFVGARGQADYYHSLGRLTWENAREASMKNDYDRINYHYAARETRNNYFARKRKRPEGDSVHIELVKNTAAPGPTSPTKFSPEPQSGNREAIHWPVGLQADHFLALRTEIEALSELRFRLGNNGGEAIVVGLRHAFRQLAKRVMEDERSGRLNDDQSKIVRRFVRTQWKQLPSSHRQNGTETLVAASNWPTPHSVD